MVSFTVVILNAALAVLSDKGLCVCVCGGGRAGVQSDFPHVHDLIVLQLTDIASFSVGNILTTFMPCQQM